MLKKIKNRVRSITKPKNGKRFDHDKWLTRHFETIVDKYAGRYILVANGRILYTNKDGSPREISEKARTRFPNAALLFFRVPRPKDFLYALNAA